MRHLALIAAIGLLVFAGVGCADDDAYEHENDDLDAHDAQVDTYEPEEGVEPGSDADLRRPHDAPGTTDRYGATGPAAGDTARGTDEWTARPEANPSDARPYPDRAGIELDDEHSFGQPDEDEDENVPVEIAGAKQALDELNDAVAEATLLLGRLQEADSAQRSDLQSRLDARVQSMNRSIAQLQQHTGETVASARPATRSGSSTN